MRNWKQVRIDAAIDVYFCDPHAPWQRGSNENTNGLLRQYFPKGTDFATVIETDLDARACELNDRPRKPCCNNRQNPPFGLRDARRELAQFAARMWIDRCRDHDTRLIRARAPPCSS